VAASRPPAERSLIASRPWTERTAQLLFAVCGMASIFATLGIVMVLAFESAGFFAEVSPLAFLADRQWTPLFAEKHYGIWPLLAGTALTTLIAMLVAVPLGLLAAVYLSEFATGSIRKTLKPTLELLAGVPTVVYGYFALTFVTPLLQRVIPGLSGFNAMSPGIVMGLMIVPIVASLSEDSIFAVPSSLREGAYALGAGRFATTVRVVLPSAFSGIAAAVILGLSRAIGETMIVAIAAGQQPSFTLDPRVPIETMTAYIVQVSLGDTPTGTVEYRTIFAVGLALFSMTLVLNLVSHFLRRRVQRGGVT
jgi:phosphate transport system permease protein